MWSHLSGGPHVIRWSAPRSESSAKAGPKLNWTLIQGNLSQFIQRWPTPHTVSSANNETGRNVWTLIQGNLGYVHRWEHRVVSLVQSRAFSVPGDVSGVFAPSPLDTIRFVGDVSAAFVTGGTVTVGGSFTQIGEVIGTFLIVPSAGFTVTGEVNLTAYIHTGQQQECIAGVTTLLPAGTPANAVH